MSIWSAYNLLRTVMWQAGTAHTVDCLRLSLQEARHHFNHFVAELKDVSLKKRKKLSQIMLNLIAHKPLKKRVGRFEPRVKKRRPFILSINARTQVYSQAKNSLKLG